jgi:hypothetical protein
MATLLEVGKPYPDHSPRNTPNIRKLSMCEEEIVATTLKLKLAAHEIALRDLQRGPLGAWWESGITQAHMIPRE